MAARSIIYRGAPALVNLGWVRSPQGLSDRVIGVRWADVFARVLDAELNGTNSLLSLIMAGVSEGLQAQTLLVAYSDPTQNVHFGALTSGGKPVLEPERLFDTKEALVAWLTQELQQIGIQGLVLSANLQTSITTALPSESIAPPVPDAEVFSATGRKQNLDLNKIFADAGLFTTIAVGGGLAAIVTLAVLTISGTIFNKPKVIGEVITETVFVTRVEDVFLQSCAGSFGKPWSIGPGWVLKEEGCTGPGMALPAGYPDAGAVAFQIFTLNGGYDPAVARSAAELVLKASALQTYTVGKSLLVTKPLELTVIERSEQIAGPATPAHRVLEALYLGKSRSVRPVGPDTEITMWGAFSGALSPLETLPWAEVRAISRKDGLIRMLVRQKQGVELQVVEKEIE